MSPETTPESLAALAAAILVRPRERQELIADLEAAVADIPEPPPPHFPEQIVETLAELVYDLACYVQNPKWRREDPSYYGNERLRAEVSAALRRLAELGVTVSDLEGLEQEWRQLDPADRSDSEDRHLRPRCRRRGDGPRLVGWRRNDEATAPGPECDQIASWRKRYIRRVLQLRVPPPLAKVSRQDDRAT
jgi:hypothetical protein